MNDKLKVMNCSSWRKMDILTPSSYRKEILIISTLWSIEHGQGETAFAKVVELNSLEIDYKSLVFETIKMHTSEKDAKLFHEKIVEGATQ